MRRILALGMVIGALVGATLASPAPASAADSPFGGGSVRAGGAFTGQPPSRDGSYYVNVNCLVWSFCMGTMQAVTVSPDGKQTWKLGGFFLGIRETCNTYPNQKVAHMVGWYVGSPGGIGYLDVAVDETTLRFNEMSALAGAHDFVGTMATPAYISGSFCL